MLEDLTVVTMDNLQDEVSQFKRDGYRLATITCEKADDGYELIYHFDRDYKMKHLRLEIAPGESVKSISGIYWPAFLIENEYQDLFGIKFEGLVIDYKGNLYLTPEGPKSPLAVKEQKGV